MLFLLIFTTYLCEGNVFSPETCGKKISDKGKKADFQGVSRNTHLC